MDKILINRSDAIGDLILTLPMASWIKINFPNSKTAFIVRRGNRVVTELGEDISEVYEIDQKAGAGKSLIEFRKIFKDFVPDVYVDVGGNKWGSMAAYLFGPKIRYGLKHKLLPWLFLNQGVSQSRSLALMHESEYNLSLLNPLLPAYSHDKLPDVLHGFKSNKGKFQKDGRRILSKEFPELKASSRKIIIHPGMTGHSLNWSARNYARLGQLILEKYPDACIIFSYTPSDSEYIKVVKEQLSSTLNNPEDRLFFLDGSHVGLSDYIKILGSVDCYIGGSTGPTHIAGIMGTPYLSIFSPIKTQSAYRWRPLDIGQKHHVIYPDVVCGEERFCAERKCPYYDCMGKIEVKDVFEHFSLILGDRKVIQHSATNSSKES